jgi:hypothetical protein
VLSNAGWAAAAGWASRCHAHAAGRRCCAVLSLGTLKRPVPASVQCGGLPRRIANGIYQTCWTSTRLPRWTCLGTPQCTLDLQIPWSSALRENRMRAGEITARTATTAPRTCPARADHDRVPSRAVEALVATAMTVLRAHIRHLGR